MQSQRLSHAFAVDILKDKRDVLLSDVDIFWRRNPLAYLQTLPKCDIYACTDVPYLPRDSKGGYRLTAPLPGRGVCGMPIAVQICDGWCDIYTESALVVWWLYASSGPRQMASGYPSSDGPAN